MYQKLKLKFINWAITQMIWLWKPLIIILLLGIVYIFYSIFQNDSIINWTKTPLSQIEISDILILLVIHALFSRD